jgi:hypothetical protein
MGRISEPACSGPLASWQEGYSYGFNEWGLQNFNKYMLIEDMPPSAIWLYGHSGGFVHPLVAGESGSHGTDYWAAANDIIVWSDDYPYGAIPAGMTVSFITKRHRYGFNTLQVSGAVHYFKWGTSTYEDWRPQ